TIRAVIDGAFVDAPQIEALAEENSDIDAVAVGGSSAQNFVLAGSISINELDNTLEARVSGGADLDGGSLVRVKALDDAAIVPITGALAVSSGFSAVGAAVSMNKILDSVT